MIKSLTEKSQGLEKLKLDCEEIKLLFPSKLTDRTSSGHQSDSGEVETSIDGICDNLVDLDHDFGATSPDQTGKKHFKDVICHCCF